MDAAPSKKVNVNKMASLARLPSWAPSSEYAGLLFHFFAFEARLKNEPQGSENNYNQGAVEWALCPFNTKP
jgi:hypothetical protein